MGDPITILSLHSKRTLSLSIYACFPFLRFSPHFFPSLPLLALLPDPIPDSIFFIEFPPILLIIYSMPQFSTLRPSPYFLLCYFTFSAIRTTAIFIFFIKRKVNKGLLLLAASTFFHYFHSIRIKTLIWYESLPKKQGLFAVI